MAGVCPEAVENVLDLPQFPGRLDLLHTKGPFPPGTALFMLAAAYL